MLKKRRQNWQKLQNEKFLYRHMYLLPCFLAFFILDAGFHVRIEGIDVPGYGGAIPFAFAAAWSLLFCGFFHILPPLARRISVIVLDLAFCIIALTQDTLLNIFSRFGATSDLRYLTEGEAFMASDYVRLSPLLVFFIAVSIIFAVTASCLIPGKNIGGSRGKRGLCGASAVILSIAAAVCIRIFAVGYPTETRGVYNEYGSVYEAFTDTKRAMLICGIYQYYFRDLQVNAGVFTKPSEADIRQLSEYFDSRAEHEDNEMTGIFAGKNLILVQLEAIDYWMTDAFMPNLSKLKDESIVFANHYTPGFITPNTLNTELIVQTGLIPDGNGVSGKAFAENELPYTLPKLFAAAGYAANSFHGNPGDVYDRTNVHINLGFEKYVDGAEMGMSDYSLDTQLINGFDLYTADSPFYSLIITYSGHGPYTEDNHIGSLHYDEAVELISKLKPKEAYYSEEEYIQAAAHAIETDNFVALLIERLETENLLDDTVLIFYSDHYNNYVMNTELLAEIKGTDDMNLIRKTDFFVYSKEYAENNGSLRVEKVTSSLDMPPTIANLFGLDTEYQYYFGTDAFDGTNIVGGNTGFVFFGDGSFISGDTYSRDTALTQEVVDTANAVLNLRRMDKILLKSDFFRNN